MIIILFVMDVEVDCSSFYLHKSPPHHHIFGLNRSGIRTAASLCAKVCTPTVSMLCLFNVFSLQLKSN